VIAAGDIVYLGMDKTLCMWSVENPERIVLPVRAAGVEIPEYRQLARFLLGRGS
jgi:hypothetical protein